MVELLDYSMNFCDSHVSYSDVRSAVLTIKGQVRAAQCPVTRVKSYTKAYIYDRIDLDDTYLDTMNDPRDT